MRGRRHYPITLLIWYISRLQDTVRGCDEKPYHWLQGALPRPHLGFILHLSTIFFMIDGIITDTFFRFALQKQGLPCRAGQSRVSCKFAKEGQIGSYVRHTSQHREYAPKH